MAAPAIKLEFPDIDGLAKEFRKLPKSLSAITQAAAVKRAMKPAEQALKSTTPKGPTGNLRRAIAIKSVPYRKTGTGVAVVGYRKPNTGKPPTVNKKGRRVGVGLAFHQFLVEKGTVKRQTSRWRLRSLLRPRNRGIMPAIQPIARAWEASKEGLGSRLETELKQGLVNAMKQFEKYQAARAARAARR